MIKGTKRGCFFKTPVRTPSFKEVGPCSQGVVYRFTNPFGGTQSFPLCQSHARHYFGEEEVNRLIKLGVVGWRMPKGKGGGDSLSNSVSSVIERDIEQGRNARMADEEQVEIKEMDADAWDDEAFTSVVEDDGDRVDLTLESPFLGLYRGMKTIEPTPDNDVDHPFNIYLFTGKDGRKRNIASNYALDQAMTGEDAPAIGDRVKVVWDGIQELKSGRTMNRISVYVAKGSGGFVAPADPTEGMF